MGSPQILICGESGGRSRPVDLAERYRHHDLLAERELHHRHEEIVIAETVDEFEVLSLPFHVLFLAVDPFLDEFLRRIIIHKCSCQFAQLFNSGRADG